MATYNIAELVFLHVAVKVLPKLKDSTAHIIGAQIWNQKGDICDVIFIAKLVRKNDGPNEIEEIMKTMIKYVEDKQC
jgi:hypothetical protein